MMPSCRISLMEIRRLPPHLSYCLSNLVTWLLMLCSVPPIATENGLNSLLRIPIRTGTQHGHA
jgi:hypothetical protein